MAELPPPGKPCPQCKAGLPRNLEGHHRVGRGSVLCKQRPVCRPVAEVKGSAG